MRMSTVGDLGFSSPVNALVLGARGGIGEAFVRALLTLPDVSAVVATGRSGAWVDEEVPDPRESRFHLDLEDDQSIDAFAEGLAALGEPLHLVINCTGLLHDTNLRPERSWRHIERKSMQRCFDVHATGLALLLAAVMPSFPAISGPCSPRFQRVSAALETTDWAAGLAIVRLKPRKI